MLPPDFDQRLAQVRARIAAAAARAGRTAEDVALVAVTKGHPPALIRAAYEAGLRDFGENRVAEMRDKQAALALPEARWHFIGHVQSRKGRQLVGHCALIHSLDRPSLAEELGKRGAAEQQEVVGLLQVNSSGEASKDGWDVVTPDGCDAFVRDVEQLLALPWLKLCGLMTMAPFYEEAEATRATFAATRALQERLATCFPGQSFAMLSMGMTNDFEIAIEEGATHVRIGTALFGARDAG